MGKYGASLKEQGEGPAGGRPGRGAAGGRRGRGGGRRPAAAPRRVAATAVRGAAVHLGGSRGRGRGRRSTAVPRRVAATAASGAVAATAARGTAVHLGHEHGTGCFNMFSLVESKLYAKEGGYLQGQKCWAKLLGLGDGCGEEVFTAGNKEMFPAHECQKCVLAANQTQNSFIHEGGGGVVVICHKCHKEAVLKSDTSKTTRPKRKRT